MRCVVIVGLVVFLGGAGTAKAVIISTGDGSGNTTAPAANPGFSNVGVRGGASAIYLGSGWVLTAVHVGDGATTFNNVSYSEVPNSAVQLINPAGAGFANSTDLMMYKIQNPPSLPALSISNVAPQIGWNVTMIGNGRDRAASPTFWNSSWGTTPTPSTYTGFTWSATNHVRWGTNAIDAVGLIQGVNNNSETAFATSFSQLGTTNEAQGAPGDSGGAVFHEDSRTGWSLVGLMFAVTYLPGQVSQTSVFGDMTYSADLSVYRNEINQIMKLQGDVNFDGIVNGADMSLIGSHWLDAGTGALDPTGDANHDGIVNAQDISIVAAQWLKTADSVTPGVMLGAATVPEPATLVMAFAGVSAAWLLSRRGAAASGRL